MELNKVIEERRSIRKFKSNDVSDEFIERILNNAILAPSAKNRQPWKIAVLKGAKKHKISDMLLEYQKKQSGKMTMKLTASVMAEAPVLLLIYRETLDDDDEYKDQDMISIGAMIEHICLTVTDLGLGSLWIGYVRYIEDEINEFMHIDNMQLVSAVSIGYADESPGRRPRKALEDVLI